MVINRTLNCGVTVAMEKIPHVGSVAIGLWVNAGAVNETEKNLGISHYIEHMFFKGTETKNAKQLAEAIDRIGGHMNAFTGKEATCYYIKTLSSNLEKACDIVLDMMLNSTFDPEEMEKEKLVVYEEMKMIEDSPDEYSQDLLYETVFKGTELSTPILGLPETLKEISRDDILQYLKENYTRSNTVISVAGNFDEEQICSYLENKLASLPEKQVERELQYGAYKPEYIVKIKDIEQAHLSLGTKAVRMEDDLYFPLALLNNIMGGSMSSRLFQSIREERGLAYSVYSSMSAYVHDGAYVIYAGVNNSKVEDTLNAIKEELALLKRDLVTEDELSMAKEQLKSSYIFGQENVNGRMFAIGKNTLLLGRVYTAEETLASIDSVTMEDIGKAAELITDPKQYSAVLVAKEPVDLKGILHS